jgi:ligand-binding SRPBCC domain-containing protein
MTVEFECITSIAAPIEAVFGLALSIDAHVASMRSSREQAVAGVTTGEIGLGEEVTWRAWHFGVRWTMTNRITELDPPNSFVDEQVQGPFAAFRHTHIFEPSGTSTTMLDKVVFSAPFGPLGGAAEKVLLGRYLRSLIETRNVFLRDSLGPPQAM